MQRSVPVPTDLLPWVQAAVVLHSPPSLAQSRFPAMVSSMLVVRLAGRVRCRGEAVPPCAWISAATTATAYEHDGAVHAVGLVLQPAAAAALWPATRGLVNVLRPLHALGDPQWDGMEAAVGAAGTDEARVDTLLQWVRQAIAPPAPCDVQRVQGLALLAAAQDAARRAGPPMGLSERQFERRFAAHWGMPPKQFRMIARLNRTLWHALNRPQGPLVSLAADQGFYDQSHMARDVRRLAGRPLQALVRSALVPVTTEWPLRVGAQAQPAQGTPQEPLFRR